MGRKSLHEVPSSLKGYRLWRSLCVPSVRLLGAAGVTLVALALFLVGLAAPPAGAASGGAVSNLTVSVNPPSAGAPATYTLNFVATNGLSRTNPPDIVLTAPTGTNFCYASGTMTDNTDPADSSDFLTVSCQNPSNVVHFGRSLGANPGDSLTLTLTNVFNATSAGAQSLSLRTNTDTSTVSASYQLSPGTVSNLTVTTAPSVPGARATYTINFTATDGLSNTYAPDVTIVAPNGTNFCYASGTMTDNTDPADSSDFVTVSCQNPSNVVHFGRSLGANPGDSLTLTLTNVINPSTPSSSYTLSLKTNEDPTAVTSSQYAIFPQGYWGVASDGGIFAFGTAHFYGSMGGKPLNAPIVGMAKDSATGGYWFVAADGGIFSFGAPFYGSMGGKPLNAPIVGMAAMPTGGGYWLVARDGGIFSFGGAHFYGSMGGKPLNAPIVGMAAAANGGGYWFVAADGGIFSFGDAHFYGSMGGKPLNKPIVGMAADPQTNGYWLVASDGGIFSFNAPFLGSMGGQPLNAPIVGMAAVPGQQGYWFIAADGGIFSFGGAGFEGSMGGTPLNAPIVGMAA